jgi:hypothetical protein
MIQLKVLLALLLLAPLATAQTRERIPPPEFVREVVVDEDGLQQWKAFVVKCEPCQGLGKHECLGCKGAEEIMANCTECDGERRSVCRTCAGEKILPDLLIEMACPFCKGSGWYNCGLCGGPGMFFTKDQNGNREELVCRACDKKGRYKCAPCGGKRRIATVRIKKKHPGEAKLKDLVEIRKDVQKCLDAFIAYEPLDRGAKSFDLFEETASPFKKKLPSVQAAVELLESTLKGIRKVGAGYQDYEAKNTFQILLMKDRTVYKLQHDLRALDQSIAREEHNALVLADK